MKASVIIPVWNGGETITYCLEALENQTVPRNQYEIIVVDDGSTDNTAEIVTNFSDVQLFYQEHAGPSQARNLGIKRASGEWILFTDADCIPISTWIETFIESVEKANADGGKGTYLTNQTSLIARFVQIEYETKYQRTYRAKNVDFVDTYSAIYKRGILLAVGGFNEEILSSEDEELSFRITENGNQLIFVPDATVQHIHADTLSWYIKKKIGNGYWKACVLRLHPSKARSDSHTPPTQKQQMALAYLLLLTLIATLIWPNAWPSIAIVLIAFAINCIPFIHYAWQRDREVAYVAPLLLLIRALALGAGMIRGVWVFWIMKKTPTS